MIVDVTLDNFQDVVMVNSKHKPVLIQFWSANQADSLTANETLEELANELEGQFILAKVNLDQEHEIVENLGILGAPVYKLIRHRDIVEEGYGLQDKETYRNVVAAYLNIDESDVLRKEAALAYAQGDTDAAEAFLVQATQVNPNNTKIHIDLVQLYLHTDQYEKAKSLFDNLPDDLKTGAKGDYLKGQIFFHGIVEDSPGIEALQQALAANSNDAEALYQLAAFLVKHEQVEQSAQALLKLFSTQRDFQDGAPQKALLTLFAMQTHQHPELIAQYRRKFQSLLY